MTDSTTETLLKFPCQYPLKIIGKCNSTETQEQFEQVVIDIVKKHCTDIQTTAIERRLSKDGNYLALTITIKAENKPQLDKLYQDLTAHELVIWAL